MPYYITQENPDCSGWAVMAIDDTKIFGCHTTKQDAIDQGVAISLAENVEFLGENKPEDRNASGPDIVICDIDGTLINGGHLVRRVYEFAKSQGALYIVTGRPESDRDHTVSELHGLGVVYRRLIMNDGSMADSPSYKRATAEELLKTFNVVAAIENNESTIRRYRDLGIKTFAPGDVPDVTATNSVRAIDLKPPAYMVEAARKGIAWFEDGLAGDGLTAQTVREARDMVAGQVTADKWQRIAAWIARHMVDLDAPDANPESDGYPSAGVVAHALWGSAGGKSGAQRALSYAQDIIGRIEAENTNRSEGATLSKIETRVFLNDFEVRETSEGMTLTGYAARFNEPSEPLPFVERIAPGAFKRSLRAKNDIKLLWNHDSSMVLGSTRAGTLRLFEDDMGLRVEAVLPDTTAGRDAKVLIQRGDVTGFSFGFTVPANGDSWNTDGTERTLKSVRLLEVSTGVAFPAYPSTLGTANVRSLEDVVMAVGVDYDALSMALGKISNGEAITHADKEIVELVLDALSPEEDMQADPATVPVDSAMAEQNDADVIALKRKKLALLELLETL
jgi:HK97 family phage prohead protease